MSRSAVVKPCDVVMRLCALMRSMDGIVEQFVAKHIKLIIEGVVSSQVESMRNWGAQEQSR